MLFTADLSMPPFGDDPVPRDLAALARAARPAAAAATSSSASPRTPELQRSPATRFLDGAAVDLNQLRRERPSSSARPQPDSSTAQPSTSPSNPAPRRPHQPPTRIQEVATAASRRRQRVGPIAGRSAD